MKQTVAVGVIKAVEKKVGGKDKATKSAETKMKKEEKAKKK